MNALRTQRAWLPALAASLVTLVGLVVLQAVSRVLLDDQVTPFFGSTGAAGRPLASILVMIVVLVAVVLGLVLVTVRGIAPGSSATPVLFGAWCAVMLGALAAQLAGLVTHGSGTTLGDALGTGAGTGAAFGWFGALAAVVVWRRQAPAEDLLRDSAAFAAATEQRTPSAIGPGGFALKRKTDYDDHARMPGELGSDGDRRVANRRVSDVAAAEGADPAETASGLGGKEVWSEERRTAHRLALAEAEAEAEAEAVSASAAPAELYGTYALETPNAEPASQTPSVDARHFEPGAPPPTAAEPTSWDDETWAELEAEPVNKEAAAPYVGKRSAGRSAQAEPQAPRGILAGRGSHRADR